MKSVGEIRRKKQQPFLNRATHFAEAMKAVEKIEMALLRGYPYSQDTMDAVLKLRAALNGEVEFWMNEALKFGPVG